MLRIYPYKMGSESAKKLKEGLSSLLIRTHNSRFRYNGQTILNWGNSWLPQWATQTTKWLNHPKNVAKAANKLTSFLLFKTHSVPTPEWTQDKQETLQWIQNGYVVYCRTSLTGHSGKGIVLARVAEECVDAPLYTKGVKTTAEYRVHVFKGAILDVQQKKKRQGVAASREIRNYSNGWVFAREGVEAPQCVLEAAKKAVTALSLDFGAVDVGYTQTEAVVFEVNTAPGITGTTLTKYIEVLDNV